MLPAIKKPHSSLWDNRGIWLLCCLGIGVIASILSRTDANWDLQNYHLYGPFAALTGRLGQDYFVSGFQGYLNPLADIPYFVVKFLIFPHHPLLVAGFAGLPYGTLVFLSLLIASQIANTPTFTGKTSIFLAVAIGITGATTLSEVGTAFDDILIADFILAGLAWYFAYWTESFKAAAGTGLAFGLAAALKLTSVLFLPAILPLILLSAPNRRAIFPLLILFGAAATLGFVIFYGWWGWLLWQHFGNPFFPLFGNFLPSAFLGPIDIADTRFFPKDLWQWIFYPFFWLQGNAYVVSEEKLRDPRFALAYLALVCGIFFYFRRPRQIRRPIAALWAFFIIAYMMWLLRFSILRYALPLEALSGVIVFTCLAENLKPRHVQYALLAILVFCLAFTKPLGYGRIGYNKTLVQEPLPALPNASLVFLNRGPFGYIMPLLAPPNSHFVFLPLLTKNSKETGIVKTLLANGAPPFLLSNQANPGDALSEDALSAFGLRPNTAQCQKITSAVQKNIQICPLLSIK